MAAGKGNAFSSWFIQCEENTIEQLMSFNFAIFLVEIGIQSMQHGSLYMSILPKNTLHMVYAQRDHRNGCMDYVSMCILTSDGGFSKNIPDSALTGDKQDPEIVNLSYFLLDYG
ncbi:hypothetical protein BDR04DRAFT_1120322 [Suillus decipiens]|nr:hypothetical protein BDR04DRAFT_1120322 [Suillus decipiens]